HSVLRPHLRLRPEYALTVGYAGLEDAAVRTWQNQVADHRGEGRVTVDDLHHDVMVPGGLRLVVVALAVGVGGAGAALRDGREHACLENPDASLVGTGVACRRGRGVGVGPFEIRGRDRQSAAA